MSKTKPPSYVIVGVQVASDQKEIVDKLFADSNVVAATNRGSTERQLTNKINTYLENNCHNHTINEDVFNLVLGLIDDENHEAALLAWNRYAKKNPQHPTFETYSIYIG